MEQDSGFRKHSRSAYEASCSLQTVYYNAAASIQDRHHFLVAVDSDQRSTFLELASKDNCWGKSSTGPLFSTPQRSSMNMCHRL